MWRFHLLFMFILTLALTCCYGGGGVGVPKHLPFKVHDMIVDSDSGSVVSYELEVYTRDPIGVVFSNTFHVSAFEGRHKRHRVHNHRHDAKGKRQSDKKSQVGLAEQTGHVKLGDQLVQINNYTTENISFAEFRQLVARVTASPPVSYHFRRLNLQQTGSDMVDDQIDFPFIHIWKATSVALPSTSKQIISTESVSKASMKWEQVAGPLRFEAATFSGKILTQSRVPIIEVTPIDGCTNIFTPGADTRRGRGRSKRKVRDKRHTTHHDDQRGLLDIVNGSIVVVDRGSCTFDDKTKHAFDQGAAGLIVVNSDTEAVVMDSPHASQFPFTPAISSKKKKRRTRRKSNASASKRAEKESSSNIFPVVSIGSEDGLMLRKLLHPKERRGVVTLFVEFALPRDHPAHHNIDQSRRDNVQYKQFEGDPDQSTIVATAGEILLLVPEPTQTKSTEFIREQARNLATSASLFSMIRSQSKNTGSVFDQRASVSRVSTGNGVLAVHFFAEPFGMPVKAYKSSMDTVALLQNNPKHFSAGLNDKFFSHDTHIISLHNNAHLLQLLCEPHYLVLETCPSDLKAVINSHMLLLPNTHKQGGEQNTSQCPLLHQVMIAQLCQVSGVAIEAEGPTLKRLHKNSIYANSSKITAVLGDGTLENIAPERNENFRVPIVTISSYGAKMLRNYLDKFPQHHSSDNNNNSFISNPRIILRAQNSHTIQWEQLAALEDARSWPHNEAGRRKLLTRLHRHLSHSEEQIHALKTIAAGHGHETVLDAILEAHDNSNEIATRLHKLHHRGL